MTLVRVTKFEVPMPKRSVLSLMHCTVDSDARYAHLETNYLTVDYA